MTQIDIGSQQFGTGVTDESGRLWRMGIPDGWDAPVMRSGSGDPTGRAGSFETLALYGARTLVCKGSIRCPSFASAMDAYRSLPSLSPVGSDITLKVYEPAGTLFLDVRQGAPLAIDPPQGNVVFFELELKAQYPYKRAVSAVTETVAGGSTSPITAAGTAAAEIEVTTTSTGTVDLTIGSLRLRTDSLPSGSVLTSGPGFDNPKRTIRGPGGENLFGLIVQPMGWPAIAPGTNSLVNGGTAGLSVRYFPTYA